MMRLNNVTSMITQRYIDTCLKMSGISICHLLSRVITCYYTLLHVITCYYMLSHVIVVDQEISGHKCLLSARNEMMAAMFDGRFLEGNTGTLISVCLYICYT